MESSWFVDEKGCDGELMIIHRLKINHKRCFKWQKVGKGGAQMSCSGCRYADYCGNSNSLGQSSNWYCTLHKEWVEGYQSCPDYEPK